MKKHIEYAMMAKRVFYRLDALSLRAVDMHVFTKRGVQCHQNLQMSM